MNIVPLKLVSDESIISSATIIGANDDYMVLLDGGQDKIFIYDTKTNEPKSIISKKGHAGDEYTGIFNGAVDFKRKEIFKMMITLCL